MEGWEEVWVTFQCKKCDIEVSLEICSVEDLIYDKIGDKDEVKQRIQEELDEIRDMLGE